MSDLTEFEGTPVVAVGVEMPNAAGGLQEAMKFDPIELHHGQEGYVVLHYTVSKVRFEPMTRGEADPLRRVHILHVDEAAPIEGKYVEKQLAQYRERIELAKEEAEGVRRLDLNGGDDDKTDDGKGLPIGEED